MSQAISPARRGLVVAVILFGAFIAAVNQLILSPILPTIMRTLEIDAGTGQWLTTIFLLVNGIMVPCTAYLTERFTTRTLYLASMLLFTVGTLLCGFAPNFTILLCGRILQAMGYGILMPLASNILLVVYPIEKRGQAMGYLGIVMSVAPAVGPSMAGWVIAHYTWNTVFLVLIPFCVIDMVVAAFLVKNLFEQGKPHLDVGSVALSTLGFGGLLYGFSMLGKEGLTSLLILVIAAVVLFFFVRRQKKLDEPLLSMAPFQNSQFVVGTIIGMMINGALIVGGIITPIYLQNVLGYTALDTAILMLPSAAVMAALSVVTGRIFDAFGARALALVGIFMLATGTMLYMTFDEQTNYFYLMAVYTYRLAGIGITMMPVNTWSLNALDNRIIPHGNAASNTLRQVAGSVGTALIVSILTMVSAYFMGKGVGEVHATIMGMHAAFFVASLMMVAAFFLAFIKMRNPHIYDTQLHEGQEA